MIYSLNLHTVERVEIERKQGESTGWTNFVFHDKDGSEFTISVFSALGGINYVPVFNSSGQEHAA